MLRPCLLLTLLIALVGIGSGAIVAQEATPSGTPTDGGIARTRLLEAPFRIPPAADFLALIRSTYAPGAQEPLGGWQGPTLTYVESGELAVEMPAPKGQIVRAPAAGAPDPATPTAPDAQEFVLRAGDALFLPAFADHALGNPGTEPAVVAIVLAAAGGDPGPPLATGGVTTLLASRGVLPDLPSGPATLTLERLTVAPGAQLPPPAASPALVAVEEGTARLVAGEGVTITRAAEAAAVATPEYSQSRPGVVSGARPAEAAGTATPGTEAMLVAGDGVLLPAGTTGTLGNAGDGPLVLLVATIALGEAE